MFAGQPTIANDVLPLVDAFGAPRGPVIVHPIVETKVSGGEPLGVIKSISAGIMSS